MMTENRVTGLCACYTGIYHRLGVLPVIKANVCYKAVLCYTDSTFIQLGLTTALDCTKTPH